MIRKNKKFIDPRYFMDEKLELKEGAMDPGRGPSNKPFNDKMMKLLGDLNITSEADAWVGFNDLKAKISEMPLFTMTSSDGVDSDFRTWAGDLINDADGMGFNVDQQKGVQLIGYGSV